MPKYKLIYFNLKARAQTTRLTFSYAGIPFEDFRIEFKDWPALKPKIFTNQLPVLEVDGKQLTESMSIARYVAREAGLLGSNNFEQAQIEAIVDALSVLFDTAAKFKFTQEGPIKDYFGQQLKDSLPKTLTLLELYLGDKQYFAGDKITLADLHFFSVFSNFEGTPQVDWKEKSSKLKTLYCKIEKEPKIAEFLKTSP